MSTATDTAAARHRNHFSGHWRGRRALVPIATLAVLGTTVLTLAGGTPAPLIAIAFVICTLAIGQKTSWLAAITAAVLGMLVGLAVLMRAYPHLGLALERSNALALAALSAAALIYLERQHPDLRLPSRSGMVLAASALVVPVAALATMATVIIRSGGTKISWAMGNDATFSLMIARFMVEDGGDNPDKHLTSAPLTYEILAAFIAPGRSSVASNHLLDHDIDRVIQVLLLMLAAMSILGAVVVAHVVPRNRVVSRIALSLLMGIVPWTWFVSGFALKYGFNNALLTGVVVTAVWIAWIESRTRPVLGTALLAMAATVLLATWAPLVLVPLGLGGLLLARTWREHISLRGLVLVSWLAPPLVFVWYMVFATLPVFRESAGALAADGAMFASHPASDAIVLGIVLAVTILGTTGRQTAWQVSGVLVIGVVGTIGALYLVAQRVDSPTGLWGYYPAKYAWLLAMFAPVVCARTIAERLAEERSTPARRAGLVAACALVITAAMAQFQPADLRSATATYPQPRTTPDWALSSVFPLISIASEGGMSDLDESTKDLMRISDPDRKTFVVRFSADPNHDNYINYWLLWQAYDDYPLIHGGRAYALVGPDGPMDEVCSIVEDWGGGVDVLTRDVSLEAKVLKRCPTAEVTFTVAPPLGV